MKINKQLAEEIRQQYTSGLTVRQLAEMYSVSPMTISRVVNKKCQYKDIAERLWEKVDIRSDDECWPWTASRNNKGYGVFRVGNRMEKAHRVAYELSNGKIPPGLIVRHTCDNPSCVNPNHLLIGTVRDNAQDAIERGRNKTKLTPEQVVQIRDLSAQGVNCKTFAERFGVSHSTVKQIVAFKTWKHLNSKGRCIS